MMRLDSSTLVNDDFSGGTLTAVHQVCDVGLFSFRTVHDNSNPKTRLAVTLRDSAAHGLTGSNVRQGLRPKLKLPAIAANLHIGKHASGLVSDHDHGIATDASDYPSSSYDYRADRSHPTLAVLLHGIWSP